MRIFTDYTIRQKIFGAFTLILVILAIVSIVPLINISTINSSVDEVIQKVQPAALTTERFGKQLNSASTILGHYLLTQETGYRDEYLVAIKTAEKSLHNLEDLIKNSEDSESLELLKSIQGNLTKLQKDNQKLIYLSLNPFENMPALNFAGKSVNPVSQEILSSSSSMLMTELDEDATRERRAIYKEISDFRFEWLNVMAHIRSYLAYRSPAAAKEILDYYNTTSDILVRLQELKNNYTFEEEEAIPHIVELQKNFKAMLDELIKIHSNDEWRTDSHFIKTEVGPLVKTMEGQIERLISLQRKKSIDMGMVLQDQSSRTVNMTLVLMIVSLSGGLLIAYVLVKGTTGPLQKITTAMRDIAQGDGDLTRRLPVNGDSELSKLADAFNAFTNKIQITVAEVAQAASKLNRAAFSVSSITSKTSKNIQSQTTNIEQVATAITEMAASIQEVSRNTAKTAESAKQAKDETERGNSIITTTVNSIAKLESEIKKVMQVIADVEDGSRQIGGVLDVINGISEQTNLLALNAAIEAARAGEQGRGFAVVADEVRTLSKRTSDSTREIQRIIERLQHGTKDAVTVSNDVGRQSNDTVNHVQEAAAALKLIAEEVNTINNMSLLIAAATHEQSTTAEEVNEKIVNTNQSAEQLAVSAEETANASIDLAKLAADLQQTVNQFKVV